MGREGKERNITRNNGCVKNFECWPQVKGKRGEMKKEGEEGGRK